MFTGIIEELGHIDRIDDRGDSIALTVQGPLAVTGVQHGDSISVSGVCLTVVEHDDTSFTSFVMRQTLDMSVHGSLRVGDPVNLERAALVGDRLGGHIVQGHVDGTAVVLATDDGDGWRRIRFALSPALSPLVVDKGSIALSGVSLTVSAVSDESVDPASAWFEVSLIPETLAATTLGALTPGDAVNVETDVLARHVRRMLRLEGRTDRHPASGPVPASGPDAWSGPDDTSGPRSGPGLEAR